MDRSDFYQILRGVLKTAVPVAVLGASPFVAGGCACPSEYRTTVVSVTSRPASFDECIQMCKTELAKHYESADSLDGGRAYPWFVSKIHHCESTTLLHNGEKARPGTLQNAVLCKYEVQGLCVGGRLPAGLQPQEQIQAASELGRYFARLCFLEQAAVVAFEAFARELQAHHAPQAFVDRAMQAVKEEQEHAQMTALLAQMYGAQVHEVSVTPQAVRSLEEIAYENAVEGCVRETYAPLTAHWQALHASSPEVRAVMGRIAEEESGHAALSWEVDAWLSPQLTPAQRAEKDRVQREAIATLGREVAYEPSHTMVEIAGFPQAEKAQQLFEGLQKELWQV